MNVTSFFKSFFILSTRCLDALIKSATKAADLVFRLLMNSTLVCGWIFGMLSEVRLHLKWRSGVLRFFLYTWECVNYSICHRWSSNLWLLNCLKIQQDFCPSKIWPFCPTYQRWGTRVTWLDLSRKFEDLRLTWLTLMKDSTWLWLGIHNLRLDLDLTQMTRQSWLFFLSFCFCTHWDVSFVFDTLPSATVWFDACQTATVADRIRGGEEAWRKLRKS